MKRKIQYALGALVGLLLFSSCEETEFRTHYPHSTPVIETATISPATFTYGDSVSITATVSDPSTPLSILEMTMSVGGKVVARQTIRTKDQKATVSQRFLVPFLSDLPNNSEVVVQLKLINVEGDETTGSIPHVTGQRKYYPLLYLVLDDGNVVNLTASDTNMDLYESPVLELPDSIRYKIASKITKDNQIDFSGDVWGLIDREVQLTDESGDYITTVESLLKYTERIIFDSFSFTTDLIGEEPI